MSTGRKRIPSSTKGSPLSPPADGVKPSPAAPLSVKTSPPIPKRPPPENPIAAKIQSLSHTKRIFLTYDFEKVKKIPTKL